MKEKIIDGIIGVLVLVLVILCVVFKESYFNLLISVGVLGLLLGILFILKKANYGFFVVSMALSLLISCVLYKTDVFIFNEAMTFMICSSVFFLMLFSTIFDFVNKRIIKEQYSLLVIATLIDLERNKNVKKECYLPIFEYEVDGIVYEIAAPYYIEKNVPSLGETISIMVNPKQHDQAYFKKPIKEDIKNISMAIFLMLACLIIIIGLF